MAGGYPPQRCNFLISQVYPMAPISCPGPRGYAFLVQILLWSSGALGLCLDLPLVILGPTTALPDSGPHTACVRQPAAGVTYQWTMAPEAGTLLTASGPLITFRTGLGELCEVTCQATEAATGETGTGTHQVRVLEPGPVPPVQLRAQDIAGKETGPLVAWVEQPVAGLTYLWDIEGGQFLSSPAQNHVLFRTGPGQKTRLQCTVPKGRTIASQGTHTLTLVDAPPCVAAGLAIQTVAKASQGKVGLVASAVHPEAAQQGFQWSIEGGQLDETTGPAVHLNAGAGATLLLRCVATHRETRVMTAAERTIRLEPALDVPEATVTNPIFQGQSGLARVTNHPAHRNTQYHWTCEGLVPEDPETRTETFRYRAPQAGPVTLTCKIVDLDTGDEQSRTHAFEVRTPALVAPARIQDLTCDPAGPLKADDLTATLKWTLDKAPERFILREQRSGREWTDLRPSDRSLPLTGLLQGRPIFSLTTLIKHPDLNEDVTDTRQVELVVPGVSVLAGDVDHVGSAYMQAPTPGATPWGKVTGLAWKAPWLYFSQGEQHTIRRVHASGGAVEEVAGMRGLQGTGQAHRDLLSEPGQLLNRRFTPPGGEPVEDWLVLQPRGHTIQKFEEGRVAATMECLVGNGQLKDPAAMAVHPATGHVFVADRGNRAIKLFSPDGKQVRTLAPATAGGIAVNGQGDVFYTETNRHVIMVLRNLEAGLTWPGSFAQPAVFAGAWSQPGAVDGGRTGQARFRQPTALAMDNLECEYLLVSDTGNHLIRKVCADLDEPMDVETVGGDPEAIQTVDDLMAVHPPTGIVAMVDVSSKAITLFKPDGEAAPFTIPGSEAWPAHGLALDLQGNLFFSDPAHHAVWVARLRNPGLSMNPDYAAPERFAGNLESEGKVEGPRTTVARLTRPQGLSLDPKDSNFLLITDPGNGLIWRVPVDLAGNHPVTHVAKYLVPENPDTQNGFKDGPGVESRFAGPQQLCGDGHGRIFVQDQTGRDQSPLIRVIDLGGNVSTLGGAPLNTTMGEPSEGDGPEVRFDHPTGISVAPSGDLYVADSWNRCVRKLTPDGRVTLAAGSQAAPANTDLDNGDDPKEARFGRLGFLGTDIQGRLVVVEPQKPTRLRLMDLRNQGKVSSVKGDLQGAQIANFPANKARIPIFAIAEPWGEKGECALKVFTAGIGKEELVDPKVKVQALCGDRRNRLWVVLNADPGQPGRLKIQRYTTALPRVNAQWEREGATLQLFPEDAVNQVSGRPYALCAEPSIIAMATDSHHNLFLADTRNGFIWKVDEQRFSLAAQDAAKAGSQAAAEAEAAAKASGASEAATRTAARVASLAAAEACIARGCIQRVAGQYPFLGPVGKDLDGPLPGLQGLALTPQDDVVVTSGNAVLRLTLPPTGTPAAPWLEAPELKLWTPPFVMKAPASSSAAKPKPTTLESSKREQDWVLKKIRAEERLLKTADALQKAKAKKQAAELASRNEPSSRPLLKAAERQAPQLVVAQREFDLAQAERDAKLAAYAALLEADYPTGGHGKAAHENKVLLRLVRAESNHKQAKFEGLLTIREREALLAADPLRAVKQARLEYLNALQGAYADEAQILQEVKGLRPLTKTDPKVEAAKAGRSKALASAERSAMDFEKCNQGAAVRGFSSWAKGSTPPP